MTQDAMLAYYKEDRERFARIEQRLADIEREIVSLRELLSKKPTQE